MLFACKLNKKMISILQRICVVWEALNFSIDQLCYLTIKRSIQSYESVLGMYVLMPNILAWAEYLRTCDKCCLNSTWSRVDSMDWIITTFDLCNHNSRNLFVNDNKRFDCFYKTSLFEYFHPEMSKFAHDWLNHQDHQC